VRVMVAAIDRAKVGSNFIMMFEVVFNKLIKLINN